MSPSKHKIWKYGDFSGSVFPYHVGNSKIYIVNPGILSMCDREQIRKKYVHVNL